MTTLAVEGEKQLASLDASPAVLYSPSLDGCSDIDLLSFHEVNAGRLIIDPEYACGLPHGVSADERAISTREAKVELGEKIAARLKLTKDGSKILWPQPTDDMDDPQNWSSRRKALHLLIITMAAVIPDFDAGIGIAGIFALARQYNTTTSRINDFTSNWSIFLVGIGSIFPIMIMRRWGRLPVLFWTQLLALIFLLVQTLAPNLNTFAAMRFLTAFFGTAPQVTGLYVVADLYPFHLQPRMLNLWSMGCIFAPYISPFAFGFLVARASWRWAYGIGVLYSAVVLFLTVFFMEETIYDRTLKPIPKRPSQGLRYRVETLVGITGLEMAKYRPSWRESISAVFRVVWRPHAISILFFEGIMFGYSVGINNTNNIILRSSRPAGYGYGQYATTGVYATPLVSVILGELVGRYLNDWIMNVSIKRNHGVFETESRLWACYVGIVMYIIGFVLLGAGLQQHLSIVVVIIGWGLAVIAVMINTVVVLAYLNDCFPKHQGEICALVNMVRAFGGFSVAYYQVQWSNTDGALQTFGVEAAISAGLFLLVIPALQYYGRTIRRCFSM